MIGKYVKQQGYIYCLYNICYTYISKNMYKIGMTLHCDQRLKTYNLNFIEKGNFIYTVLVEDMHLAELITFIKLRDFRIYENKEFFICDINVIKKTFDEIKILFENVNLTLNGILIYLDLLEYKEENSNKNTYEILDKIFNKNMCKILKNKLDICIEKSKINKNYDEYILLYHDSYIINSKNMDFYDKFIYNTNDFINTLSNINSESGYILIIQANEYKYYNTNLYKIIVCKKNNNYKKYKSQYTKINYMCFKTKNLLSTLIIINEILINNIFCYNYYKIHDIKYLVEKVKNIINVSNSNNIIENYLLLKKQVTYRYTKLSNNLSSDEENDDDKISLLKSIYSKEKTINIINYNKSKKSKGIFIDTNY